MQITINTDTDDLPAVIRMLQAYREETPAGRLHKLADKALAPPRKLRVTNTSTGETIAELTPSTFKITNHPIDITDDEPDAHCDTLPNGDCVSEDPRCMHQPAPEQVFAAPPTVENYAGQAGGSGGNGPLPKSLFDAPPPHTDVTVDAAGLPWDARIHSGAKSKLANGNWKLLRGVDPALVASVEAELRGASEPAEDATGPSPAPAPPAPPVAPPTTAAAVAPPVSPPAPPVQVPPPAPKPITNAAELVAAVMDKRFTTDQVNAACQAVGVENVASLLAKQDKLPAVLKELGV